MYCLNVSIEDDPRSGFGSGLGFLHGWSYIKDNRLNKHGLRRVTITIALWLIGTRLFRMDETNLLIYRSNEIVCIASRYC